MLVTEAAVRNQDGLFSPCFKVVLHILRLGEVFLKAEGPGPDPKARILAFLSVCLSMGLLRVWALRSEVHWLHYFPANDHGPVL